MLYFIRKIMTPKHAVYKMKYDLLIFFFIN